MMAYFKQAESNRSVLDKKIKVMSNMKIKKSEIGMPSSIKKLFTSLKRFFGIMKI